MAAPEGSDYRLASFVHERAMVDEGAIIGSGTRVWANAHICADAKVGQDCNIGQNVFVDNGAVVGSFCKLQNNVNVYDGVTLEDYVFCGPSMTFTNVSIPRCEFPRDRDGEYYLKTYVCKGASIGAQAVIVCGHRIGEFALVGSGAVVASDVPAHALVVGNPAKRIGWVCRCGQRLDSELLCADCGRKYEDDGADGLKEVR